VPKVFLFAKHLIETRCYLCGHHQNILGYCCRHYFLFVLCKMIRTNFMHI